ncbi:SusC/RagA family TonB-linked outer membrane protein [Sphingobacterium gobiense]|uniref:SusC/RagA family TonB-linked outer membrane protein n=2 Tax=Sphingobacterium gobiense TaxID=1382456 RepID=A0A2S9JGI2_9SPHI|nr:SusC/RagA family TonB-linked outer membrane protein [Sphingobacterium gobiense]
MKMNTIQTRWKCRALLLWIGVCLWGVSQPAMAQQRLALTEAIKHIEQRFNANLSYEHNLLQGKYTDTDALKGTRLEEVLKKVLYPNQLVFLYVDEKAYTIVKRTEDSGRTRTTTIEITHTQNPNVIDRVSGSVRSASGRPISFASVWVQNTRKGAKTDENGVFLLYDIQPADIVVVSALGYADAKINVAGRKELVVTLEEEENLLEEVVISTGYQKISKERATGSAAVITAKDLEKVPAANLIPRIEGAVPGLQISLLSGDRSFNYNNNQLALHSSTRTIGTNDYNMSVRGVGSVATNTEKSPLVVIDGAISTMDLGTLNPNDIETITVLRDAAAASIYGVRAANGVIVVTTKKGNITGIPRINFSVNSTFSGRPDLDYLKMMNSGQMIDYLEELVDKDILTVNNVADGVYQNATYYGGAVAEAAIRLKSGDITQQEYNQLVDPLRGLNNRPDVEKYILQPMHSQQYNFSISNGTENSRYFYSASYANETPYTKGDNGKRLTLNMNNTWEIFNLATLSTSIKGNFLRHQENALGLGIYSTGSTALLPFQMLADEHGNGLSYDRLTPGYVSGLGPAYKDWRYNYLQELDLADNLLRNNNYLANINLDVPLYKGLKASVMYANERTFGNNQMYQDEQSYYNRDLLNRFTPLDQNQNAIGITRGGVYTVMNTNVNNYTLRGQLNYDRLFQQLHEITALAGSEIRQTQLSHGSSTLYGYNRETGFNTDVSYNQLYGYPTLMGWPAGLPGAPSYGDRRRRFLSYFGNAAYTYNGRYTVSGSVRYDDYNNFGLDRSFRATPLWSAGAKWNVMREDFMQGQTAWLNQLSLRATYGVNGNISQDLRPFTYIAMNSGNLNVTNLPSADIIALANPQLRWEKTYVTNIGLDVGLLSNRLTGTIDWYHKDGRDLLYNFPIAAAYAGTVNAGNLDRNTATMVGKGIDIGLTGVVVRQEDWHVDLTANLSYNTNKITDNRFDPEDIPSYNYSYTPIGIRYIQGRPSDQVFAFRHAGLDENGLTQVYNKAGEIVAVDEQLSGVDDLLAVGRRTAPYFGSLRTNMRYKNWSVFALLTYQFGNVFTKPSVEAYMTPSRGLTIPKFDLSADIADRWREPGDEARTITPALTNNINGQYSLQRYTYSDINVLKGDYIRLREISLSYALPKSFANSMRLERVNVSGSIRNLGLIWTANKEGYDPDFVDFVGQTTNLRPVPSYNFSVNVSF